MIDKNVSHYDQIKQFIAGIKLGSTMVAVECGNRARNREANPRVYDAEVIKCGRKWITVRITTQTVPYASHQDIEFSLEDLRQKTIYTPDFNLVSSADQYLADQLRTQMIKHIREQVHGNLHKMTLGEINTIYDLLNKA